MLKSNRFITSGLIMAMVAISSARANEMNFDGLAYELVSDVALAFQNENERAGGYSVDTITVGSDMTEIVGRNDVLNYGGDTQYVKMTGVTIPSDFQTKPLPKFNENYGFDFLGAYDGLTIPEAIEKIKVDFNLDGNQASMLNSALSLLNSGKIHDGYLKTGDMVVDGQYGRMFQQLVAENPDAKEALVYAIANAFESAGFGSTGLWTTAGNMGIDMIVEAVSLLGTGDNDQINELVTSAQDSGVPLDYTGTNKPLTLTANQMNMVGGNLIVKNGVTMYANNVDITGGNITVAPGMHIKTIEQDGEKVEVASENAFLNTINATNMNMSGGALTVDQKAKLTLSGDDFKIAGNAKIENNGVLSVSSHDLNITGNAAIVNDGNLLIKSGNAITDRDISGTGNLNIASGTVLNIGDATITQDSINLDGTLIANLVAGQTKFTTHVFNGDGKLSLILKQSGEYDVFGDATFAYDQTDIDLSNINSALYNLAWSDDGKSVSATMKTVVEIATENNLSPIATTAVASIANAESDTLNNFSTLIQERLISGDIESVEKASKSIHPETKSVHQAVTTGIVGTISNLATNRMSVPTFIGRNGGDLSLAGGVWAQGLYNKSKLNSEFNGYTRGVAAGIDGTINRTVTVGAGYAFNHSDVTLDTRDIEIDSHTIFAYGQYKPSAWFINAVLNYTMSDYTETADALGVALNADYNLDMIGASVMTGYDTSFGLTPETGIRYIHVSGDTYTNNLGIRSKINAANYLTSVLGAKYVTTIDAKNGLILRPELRAAALYDFASDRFNSAVSMPGVTSYGIRADRLERVAGQFGAGMSMVYSGANISLNYIIEVRKDYTSQTGMVRARYSF